MDGVLHDRPKGTLEMQASGASQAAPLEVWLRHFADQCSDIVTLHDAAFRTVHINDACRRLIGDRARDLPMIAVDEKMFCAAGRRVVEQGTPQRIEMRTLDGTGGERWLNMELMSVLVPGGEVPSGAGCICYMAIGRDVTQERRQRQLLWQAERLMRLGEMAATLAHEISQPVAVIGLAAENALLSLSQPGGGLAGIASRLQRILDQTDRIGAIMGHVRRFGRAEPGDVEDCDVPSAINAAVLLVESRCDAARVTLRTDLPADLPQVRAVAVLLEQALMNLLSNACDAYAAQQPGGPRVIDVTARQHNDHVVITVLDRAGGIAPAVLQRLFEPFVTGKAPGQGTGLGLSISRAALRGMGGDLSGHNTKDGAMFELRLGVIS
jgi:C4-dicarboxylate-specific signal transduction histidine kinase